MAQSIFSQQDFVKWDGIKIEINQKTQGYAKSCNEYQRITGLYSREGTARTENTHRLGDEAREVTGIIHSLQHTISLTKPLNFIIISF